MKTYINLSMLNKKPTGVGIYSENLLNMIIKKKTKWKPLYIKEGRLISLYRIFWNFFILPFLVGKGNVVSFSSHGSPFIKRQIITIHDLICLNFPKQHKFQFLYFKYLLPILLRSSKKIIAISAFTKEEIIKFYRIPPEKIEVIHNGSNEFLQKTNLTTESEINKITKGLPFFLSVGNSYSHKNTFKLLEVAKLMKEKPVVFLILGADNVFLKKIKEKAERENLSNVVFLNYVSKELLAGFYQKCIANIYISLYEGFGFPPMEAAYFNSVSVVSDIPVMNEIYGNSVIYVNPNSSSDIMSKLDELLLNKIDLTMYKNKFDKLFETYNWEKTAEKTINLINKEFNLE